MFAYPCKGCENRKVGCHSRCEDYKRVHDLNEALKTAEQKEMIIKDFFVVRESRMRNRNRHIARSFRGHKK